MSKKTVYTGRRVFSRESFRLDWPLYCMLFVPVILAITYNYIPMFGILISFKKYLPAKGFFASKWVGFANFETLFTMSNFKIALWNTVTIALFKIVLHIVIPVIFTLMLNEISHLGVKKTIQTVIYLPHFISWVLLAGIFNKLLSGEGIVNQLLCALGGKAIIFLGDNKWFKFTLILTDVWKEFGYGTIVYLAAIAGVNEDLYEAASMDGAGHWQQMWHVTMPCLLPTIVMMSALSLGNILNAGFDQVYNMYNSMVMKSGDILDTLVYRVAFSDGNFGLSTAAGLFKSVISMLMTLLAHRIAYVTTGYKIF